MKSIKTALLVLILCVFTYAQMAPPQNLTATATNNNKSVKLTWEHDQSSSVRYFVFKKDAPADDTTKPFRRIAIVNHKEFIDIHLAIGITYSYFVKAVSGPNQSLSSNIVEFTRLAPVIAFGKINGFVIDELTSLPLSNATLRIQPIDNINPGNTVLLGRTDSNGFYSVRLKVGNYKMFVGAPRYVGEFYDNASTPDLATILTVADNDSLLLNQISLAPVVPPVMYTVSGNVKDADGIINLTGRISAFVKNRTHIPPNGFGHYNARTDSLGNFSFNVKQGDTLALFIKPDNHSFKSEFWNGKTTIDLADLIVVSDNVTGIDFTLDPKPIYNNGVAGTVYDSAGTLGLKGHVYLVKKDLTTPNPHNLRRKIWVATDSLTGAFSFSNLEPGEYIALAVAKGYKASYFKYDGIPTMDWHLADSIVVSEDGNVGNINFYLKARNIPNNTNSSALFGYTYESTGMSTEGILTFVTDGGGNLISASISDPSGFYLHEDLTDGYYLLTANGVNMREVVLSGISLNHENGNREIDLQLSPDGTTSVNSNSELPEVFNLLQNYPNPFNPSTQITFALPEASVVTLKIFNITGQEISTLINNESLNAGNHVIVFDASKLANGVYLYRIESGSHIITKKMTLLK